MPAPALVLLLRVAVAARAVGSPMPPCHARAHTQLRGVTFKTRTLLKDTDDRRRRVVAATVAQQSNMRKIVPVMHPMEESHPRFAVVMISLKSNV